MVFQNVLNCYVTYISHGVMTLSKWWVAAKSTFHVGMKWNRNTGHIRRADSPGACLYSSKVHSHTVHQPSRRGLSDVSEAPKPSSPFALRSFQANMCAGILPQLRQGLARSAVGTSRVWENRGSVPLSFPHRHSASFSLALVHEATSLPSFSPLLYLYLLHVLTLYSSTFSF